MPKLYDWLGTTTIILFLGYKVTKTCTAEREPLKMDQCITKQKQEHLKRDECTNKQKQEHLHSGQGASENIHRQAEAGASANNYMHSVQNPL